MSKEKSKIIIVKKVQKGHGGHHGGSWKVAYADFVTAMMAFFMVMWLLGLDDSTRGAIETYFNSPVAVGKGMQPGITPLALGQSATAGQVRPLPLMSRAIEERRYEEIGERIRDRLAGSQGLDSVAANVEIVVTKDGLRIELVEGKDGELFFEFGSSVLKPAAARALAVIATEFRGASSAIVVEGHTDAAPLRRGSYSNWELSADRANAARRAMEGSGLGARRVQEIRGHADRYPRNKENPLDPANRRISILLPFSTPPAETHLSTGEPVPGGAP